MPNDFQAAATCFRLSFRPPLTEPDAVTVTLSFEDNTVFFKLDSEMRTEKSSCRQSLSKFDSAD